MLFFLWEYHYNNVANFFCSDKLSFALLLKTLSDSSKKWLGPLLSSKGQYWMFHIKVKIYFWMKKTKVLVSEQNL